MSNAPPKERFDEVDRQQLPAAAKLAMLCDMTREKLGVDPRAGGWCFVGKPLVIATVLKELPRITVTLMAKTQVGKGDGADDQDAVFTWNGIKFRVRHNAKGDVLHAFEEKRLPPSKPEDRVTAAEMRFAAWKDIVS